jgi:hypothetical protein
MPAYWWIVQYVLRWSATVWKYTLAIVRKRIVQHVETDYLAPDTAQ